MLKEVIKRGLFGFITGVFIGKTLSIINAALFGIGTLYSVPAYVIMEYFITGLIGMTFAITSLIFEADKWSLTLQTIVHFLATSVVMYISAILLKWVKFNVISTLAWFGVFIVIYFIFWLCFYCSFRKAIKEVNKKLGE